MPTAPSSWPADGSKLDLADKKISGFFFRLLLPLPLECVLSVPGAFFGMPAFHSVAPATIACALGGCREAPETAMYAYAMCVCLLLAAWAYVQSSPSRVKTQAHLHTPPALVLSPMLGVALTRLIADAHAQSAAYLYLVVWYSSILPVITFKSAAGRRRPLASDAKHIGAEAVKAVGLKGLPNIPRMHATGDPNSAFPSGDVAGAVAFAFPLLRCTSSWSVTPASTWLLPACGCTCVLLSACGRMYYQAHHLLDVVCGALFAAGSGLLLETAFTGGLSSGDACSPSRGWWEPFVALVSLAAYAKLTKVHKAVPAGQKVE